MPPTVHLIDASPYLFRAWFSLPRSIVDTEGKPANAVYGFATFVAKYITEERPGHVAVAFDRHFNGSFRNDFYPPYKAHREASPPELDAQVDPCVEVVDALGAATFIDERYEADDLIATIIDRTSSSGAHYVIVSPDKDLTQLVSDRVTLVDPARNLRFDPAAVEAKFGVRPDQMTDFLGLAGDAVDNIPGVRGIGPKTAAELLRRHGSLEGIYEQVPAMRHSAIRGQGSIAAKLEKDVANAGLSKRLATVSVDAPIAVTLNALRYRGPDDQRIRTLFARLGFNTLQGRLGRR
ncbi:MAG: exodeoxyribonuclease IX [Acidobacteriota bacterium]|nr:exodeoxyribonuclease IX [Acidobacteriota bacterium]